VILMQKNTLEYWQDWIVSSAFHPIKNLIQRGISEWFFINGRDLPWRHTRDPYKILLSEIMLQQTQVDRVIIFYYAFLKKLPDFRALANASEELVLKLWGGLGYYNRARNLQKIAKTIISEYNGIFPTTKEEILALPGIGEYTAGAVMSFALGIRAPIVDTNVNRVWQRLFHLPKGKMKPSDYDKILWMFSEALLPEKDIWEFNQAIMDFGAMQCVSHKPRCKSCPFHSFCRTYQHTSLARFM